jgi:hypothetical protein
MAQWTEDLKAVALEKGRGASAAALTRAGELPGALTELYRAMNGASLPGDVRLFPLKELPAVGPRICFGQKGRDTQLFALRRADLYGLAEGGFIPAWVEAIEPDAWVYAATGGREAIQVYSTLERLLAVKVPPPPPNPAADDFGDHTFARALETVREAIVALRHGRAGSAGSSQRKAKPKAKAPRPSGTQRERKPASKAAKTKGRSKPRLRR